MPKFENDKLAKRYLLGELSEQERAGVEEEYFADDEAFERLSAVEDDLIDAYTLGQLSVTERRHFEQSLLLSSVQRERVRFARTLLHTVSGSDETVSNIAPQKRTASRRVTPFAFLKGRNPVVSLSVAAMLILAVLAGWILIHNINLTRIEEQQTKVQAPPQDDKPADANTQEASQRPKPIVQPQEPKEQPIPHTQSSRVLSFALVEGTVRDVGESNRLIIPEDAGAVRLDLTIGHIEHKSYRADLRMTEGKLVWRRSGISVNLPTAGKSRLTFQLPANILRNGDYILTISGATKRGVSEVAGEYSFQVVRK